LHLLLTTCWVNLIDGIGNSYVSDFSNQSPWEDRILKLKLALCVAAIVTAPAIAQEPPSDTVKAVVEKGVTMDVQGNVGDIEYKSDGTFSGFDGMFAGTYKTDGNKLCITVEAFGLVDQCQAYPDGKKSGDTFELTSDMGTMQVTIR
jgi:hypothetical protein